jgi:hypothetical protein
MDRDGGDTLPIAAVDESSLRYFQAQWSFQANALLMTWIEDPVEFEAFSNDSIYVHGVAFPEERLFVDLCVSADTAFAETLVLSPDGSQVARIVDYEGQQWLSIFDWRENTWYVIAPMSGWELAAWADW